jgi:hypothetical protein
MSHIAREIFRQIGGSRWAAMVNGKVLSYSYNSVTLGFMTGKNKAGKRVNRLKILLTPLDTYTLQFSFYTPSKGWQLVEQFEYTYADQLVPVFESETGLRASL